MRRGGFLVYGSAQAWSFVTSHPEGETGMQAQTHDSPLACGYRMYGLLQFSVGGQRGPTNTVPTDFIASTFFSRLSESSLVGR